MARLSPDKTPTIEVEAVAFTDEQIQTGLTNWSRNLAKARAEEDILAVDTALRFIDTWLDRKLKAER